MESITSAEEQPQLQEVVVLDLCERELNALINERLPRLGDNLEAALTKKCECPVQVQPYTLQQINLRYKTKLKTIMMYCLRLGVKTSQILLDLISRITLTNLNKTTFPICRQDIEEPQSIDWKEINLKPVHPRVEILFMRYEVG